MKERPILFSAPMVRAILEGRKTMTRRAIKPQPDGEQRPLSEWSLGLAAACHDHSPDQEKLASHSERLKGRIFPFTTANGGLISPVCPYGQSGDRLWVRESFAYFSPKIIKYADGQCSDGDNREHYTPGRWRPSIHMPRWASRITLEITNVRVERLQDMHHKADQFEAEGIVLPPSELYQDINRSDKLERHFIELWNSINGPDAWDKNPFVWVIEFKKLSDKKAAA